MSTFDDDDIEFDFFDEPETQEATQRRRIPRFERPRRNGGDGPPRRPIRPPAGLTPLLRLVGLVALLIFVVVVLVFWVQSCQGASKRSSYESYMAKVRTIAASSSTIGRTFGQKLTTPGIKQAQLRDDVGGLAQQAQQQVAQAQSLRPPGPLRAEHEDLVQALQLRAAGLSRLAGALGEPSARDASRVGRDLARAARLLTASDVQWQVLFHDAAVERLKQEGVKGVNPPTSTFVASPELVSQSSMVQLVQSFRGATTGGRPTGRHGNGLVSVKAEPSGTQLSTSEPTAVKASTELAFAVTVENSGCCREVRVPVTITIPASPKPIVLRKTIDVINPSEQVTVTIPVTQQVPFGPKIDMKVAVAPVPGEQFTANNSATYPVFFSIG